MEDKYKIVITDNSSYSNPLSIQDQINLAYEEGWELVQILPHHHTNTYWLILKRKDKKDPYRQISDICPAQMWPKTHFFKNGEELSAERGKTITLRDMLNFFKNEIERGTPIRIYSKQNNSVVGSVIDGKELIPENVYDYKYIDARVEPNIRLKNAPDILVIIIE